MRSGSPQAMPRETQQQAERVRKADERLARTAGALLERIAQRLEARFDGQIERLAAERAAQTERERAVEVTSRLEAEAERVRAEGTKELRELAESLQAKLEEAQQDAERARAAEERVREEANLLHAEVDTALATTEAIGEQLQELTAALYERHGGTLQGKPLKRPAESPGRSGGAIDINDAAAQDLRGLHISQTQAARLIHHRDELGGFTSLEQLDYVPGFSKELREELKQHLSV